MHKAALPAGRKFGHFPSALIPQNGLTIPPESFIILSYCKGATYMDRSFSAVYYFTYYFSEK